jgi:hypothetical protein
VVELRSEKVLRHKLDDDVVDLLGKCLSATARGPFLTDQELADLVGRSRETLDIAAGMWPKLNLAAPEVLELLERVVEALLERAGRDPGAWEEWIGARPAKVEAVLEVFRRVSSGKV